MLSLFAATVCLIAIPFAHSQGSQSDAAPAKSAPSLNGPSFIPDGSFRGSTLAGWHTLGQADWRADQGEITRKGTGGSGWLVLDRSAELVPQLVHNRSGAGSVVLAVGLHGDGRMHIVTSTRSGAYIFWGKPQERTNTSK
jgi:hypothetical protein